ncbi:MAG: hypothetical protein KDJ38_04440 [Gammaproteobacteria bacterium]|nr:hypothetical protein [Gammaproteobacteria bacterium]
MTTLEKNWREQQIEQHLKQQYGEQFLSLPRAGSEKTLRSTILSLLGKSMHAANFESLDYQFLDPQTIAVETLDHQTTVQMQAEVVLLRGKLRHMEDFYTFLDFLQEHASYYELRGCDILRVDEGPGKPDSTPLELPGLQMSCMINWFLLRQGTL